MPCIIKLNLFSVPLFFKHSCSKIWTPKPSEWRVVTKNLIIDVCMLLFLNKNSGLILIVLIVWFVTVCTLCAAAKVLQKSACLIDFAFIVAVTEQMNNWACWAFRHLTFSVQTNQGSKLLFLSPPFSADSVKKFSIVCMQNQLHYQPVKEVNRWFNSFWVLTWIKVDLRFLS